jgi:hypothetical protein
MPFLTFEHIKIETITSCNVHQLLVLNHIIHNIIKPSNFIPENVCVDDLIELAAIHGAIPLDVLSVPACLTAFSLR